MRKVSIICSMTGTQWTVHTQVVYCECDWLGRWRLESWGLCWESGCVRGSRKPCPVFPMVRGNQDIGIATCFSLLFLVWNWFNTDTSSESPLWTSGPWKTQTDIGDSCKRQKSFRGILPLKCTKMDKIMWQIWSKSGTHRPEAWKSSPEASLGLVVLFHTITAVLQLPA